MIDLARLALATVGAGLLGFGGWLHYPPLGFSVAGALLFAIATIGALRAG